MRSLATFETVIMDDEDAAFIRTLAIPPNQRSQQENAAIFSYLRTIEGLNIPSPSSAYRDAELRSISRYARYRRVPGDVLLYHIGEWCDAWFILISGSVLIESSMFLPRACFGTRTNGNFYRRNDCLVLEPSDLVVIDYLDSENLPVSFTDTHRQAVAPYKTRHSLDRTSNSKSNGSRAVDVSSNESPSSQGVGSLPKALSSLSVANTNAEADKKKIKRTVKPTKHKSDSNNTSINDPSRVSHLSDTSSAHSLSSGGGINTQNDLCHGRQGFFQSSGVTSTPEKRDKKHSSSSNSSRWGKTQSDTSHLADSEGEEQQEEEDEDDDDDEEEEDEEEDLESGSHESIRDAFWESILKLPSERTQEDIDLLLENVEQLPAFSNLTKATCRSLCSVMVLAIVREAGQIVLNDNEKLDTWSVVLNGTVEVIEPDGTIRELTRGDAFGIRPGKTDRIHRGVMRTVTEDCYFLCVPQADYMKIISREGEAEIPELGEGGRVVLVYESINLDTNLSSDLSTNNNNNNKSINDNSILSKKCRLVTKGTPEKLIEHLIADLSNVDITYPEDFLLTYRTFLDSPRPIVDRLLSWHLHNPKLRSRVNRIILLWVHNHFNDFEDSYDMMKSIEKFDHMLSSDGTAGERRLFRLACSTKARPRHVELVIPLKNVRQNIHSENKSLGGEQHVNTSHNNNNNNNNNNHLIDLPFTMIGGEDGFGVFIHQVHSLIHNNNNYYYSEVTLSPDSMANQKSCPTTVSLSSSSTSSSCDSGYPSSYCLPSVLSIYNQIRRADQLLAVNGRSVEHLKPIDVVQIINSMINACCPLDNIITQLNTSHHDGIVNSTSSLSSSSHISPDFDHCKATISSSSSSGNATFNLRLLVVFNPVQYYQVINSMNSNNNNNNPLNNILEYPLQTIDDVAKPHSRRFPPLLNTLLHNGEEFCRLKKHSLPTSISIPSDLVTSSTDRLQSSPNVLSPISAAVAPLTTTSGSPYSTSLNNNNNNNNSLGRRGQIYHPLTPHMGHMGRSSHSANTSPTRISNQEDNQDVQKTTGTDNKRSSNSSQSRWSHSRKDSSGISNNNNNNKSIEQQPSPTDKFNYNNNNKPLGNCTNSPLQRCSSQPDLVAINALVTSSSSKHQGFNESTSLHNHQHFPNDFDHVNIISTNNNNNNNSHPAVTIPPIAPVNVTGGGGGGGGGGDHLSVIRVWRANDSGKDQSSKLIILPHRQTTAYEATRLCIEEFGIPEEEQQFYCLYHVTVESGPIVKQSRLANIVDDLAGRLTLNSRYYLKNLRNHDPLIADDIAKSILADSRVTFIQLPPEELAARLTLDDYEVFRAVQSTEYIDEVFGLSSNACMDNMPPPSSITSNSSATNTTNNNNSSTSGTSMSGSGSSIGGGGSCGYATGHENLDRFTDLVNREAYWAPTEICNESNLNRRVDLLKRFIKLAKLCRELRNFNTMFCLLVGLHQTCVERLKQTWERLPSKYQKIYRDLSMVLDTSRNFHHYRTLISSNNVSAPMLPYLPLVLKDLTFIHLGNPSRTPDGLINFVKLRMLAKEVRAICRMCNVDYDLCSTVASTTIGSGGGGSITGHRGRLSGGGSRSRVVGVNLSAVKAVASVSMINPKSYFSNITSSSSMNNSQTNNTSNTSNNMNGTDSSCLEYDTVETVKHSTSSMDENKQQQQQQREKKLSQDTSSTTTNMTSNNSAGSGTSTTTNNNNAGNKRLHQLGTSTTPTSSGNFNFSLPISSPVMISGSNNNSSITSGAGGGGIRRRSNLAFISSTSSSSASASVNAKKIYESWLMTLRIRTYLANLKIVQDPELLSQLSVRLEPSAKDSKTGIQPIVIPVTGVGNCCTATTTITTTTITTTTTTTTSEGSESHQFVDVCSLSSPDNRPESKDSKLSAKSCFTQPAVIIESNSSVKKLSSSNNNSKTVTPSPASSTTSVSSSSTITAGNNNGSTFSRPILGAQSIEDARKLLALSEGSKRSSQRRLPAFTFPNHHTTTHYSHNNNNNNHIFMSPMGPYAGIGFGQLKSYNNNNNNTNSNMSSHHMHNHTIQMLNSTQISSPQNSSQHLHPNSIQQQYSQHHQHHLHNQHQHQHQNHHYNHSNAAHRYYYHHHHQHQNHPQTTIVQTRFSTNNNITTNTFNGSKSLLLDNLIPIPSRITTATSGGNPTTASNQIYASLMPSQQRNPCQMRQQQQQHHHHNHNQQQQQQLAATASPPHHRSQSTSSSKQHHQQYNIVQTSNHNHHHQNYQYQQQQKQQQQQQAQQNLQSRSNYIGPRPTPNPNSSSSCTQQQQQQQQQQMSSCAYWHANNSSGGPYTTTQHHQHHQQQQQQQQQVGMLSTRSSREQSLLQQQQQQQRQTQQQQQNSLNSDENYLYPTANTHPLGGGGGGGHIISIPYHFKQSTVQKINPHYLNAKPTRPPPPYELALALRQPQGETTSTQQQQQQQQQTQPALSSSSSLKHDVIMTTTRHNNNNHNLSPNPPNTSGSSSNNKQPSVGRTPMMQAHTQLQNPKVERQLFPTKHQSNNNNNNHSSRGETTQHQQQQQLSTSTSSSSSLHQESTNQQGKSMNSVEQNKLSSPQQRIQQQQQQRPSPPSYQQVLSMTRQGSNQGSLKIISAQSHSRPTGHCPMNGQSQPQPPPPQRTMATLSSSSSSAAATAAAASNCNHGNFRASSASPGISIIRPIVNDLNSVEPRQKHLGRSTQKTTTFQ
uniref:Rap guanine nucleotide exchange factor 2 n=1 Tax=Trichobilharzia regenti TaxID=157069 RepID=A0AA85IPE1_TRIRE|nr:unnamed protein product [Trichobilharzia regenti]